jgi:hypothetical protein
MSVSTMSRSTMSPRPVVRRRRSLPGVEIVGWVLVPAAFGIWIFDVVTFAQLLGK